VTPFNLFNLATTKRIKSAIAGSILMCGLFSGCQSLHYMGQAVSGHLDLLNRRQPTAELIEDPQTPPELRDQLLLADRLLLFAEQELLLPAGDQYRLYVSLERPYVVWNVFAAPELSLEPKTWCYPVAGCTVYRGFFAEGSARRCADRLAGSGYDVMVGGVPAYSTLGWFSDPLLSTFIHRSETGLAELIFHELAHQLLYVRDDSMFNESFATAVAQEGLRRWFQSRDNLDAYRRYEVLVQDRHEVVTMIAGCRDRLQQIYRSRLPDTVKRRQKAERFQKLRREFESRRRLRDTLDAFSSWFDVPLNNARLVSLATYHDYVPAFRQLLENNQNDLDRFYRQCRELAGYPPARRRSTLQQLVRSSAHRADR
jgi:predicted aminopeptidase